LQRQVEELLSQLIEMKKKKLEESDHEFIANFENPFKRHDK
jgi:hypothetical protein